MLFVEGPSFGTGVSLALGEEDSNDTVVGADASVKVDGIGSPGWLDAASSTAFSLVSARFPTSPSSVTTSTISIPLSPWNIILKEGWGVPKNNFRATEGGPNFTTQGSL